MRYSTLRNSVSSPTLASWLSMPRALLRALHECRDPRLP